MVRIRLRRVGLRNQPSYRIVVADKESPRDGRFLEIVGFYNPRTEPATIEFQEDRIYDWLSKGAQPSEPVSRLFKVVGLMDRFKRYKAGESIEKILADAKAFYGAREVNPRTRRDAAAVKPAKKKAKAEAKEEPKGAVEAEAKPVKAKKAEAAPEPAAEPAAPEVEAEATPAAAGVAAEAAPAVADVEVEATPAAAEGEAEAKKE